MVITGAVTCIYEDAIVSIKQLREIGIHEKMVFMLKWVQGFILMKNLLNGMMVYDASKR